MTLAVREKGIALVTGEVGTGKSTAVRAFIASLDTNRHALLYLTLPINSPTALYRQLLGTLNQPVPFGAAAQIAALRNALAELIQSQRKTPVIVIDEAHLLPHTLIDPLRTLISAQLDSQSLAALVLMAPRRATFGQPELKRMLQLSTHAAFAQRITHRAHIEPLGLEATLAYIDHHLKVAGIHDSHTLFSDESGRSRGHALKRIAEWTQGIPRKINQICIAACQ